MDPSNESRRALEALRQHVQASRHSQRRLEDRGGFSRGTLSQLLAGQRQLKLRHLLALLGALEISPGRFFGSIYPDARQTALARVRERARDGTVTVPRDMDALYDFGLESLATLRRRIERCERAIDHFERIGLVSAADIGPRRGHDR